MATIIERWQRWTVAGFAAAAAVLVGGSPARGQCGEWVLGPGQGPAGMNPGSNVRASVLWDPDGAEGPAGEVLVLAGDGSLLVTPQLQGSVVTWDGTEYRGMGLVLPGSGPRINALAVYNGELIAAGTMLPNGNVLRWDGAGWQPVGTGIGSNVLALAVYGGELFAGGILTAAGGQPVSNIARWDGAAWQPVGTGVDGTVLSLRQFGDDLVVGGSFTAAGEVALDRIGRWDGSQWSAMGGGMGSVQSLGTWNGSLIAGIFGGGVHRWDGEGWTQLGTSAGHYFALQEYEGDLIAAGSSTIGRWNGLTWTQVAAPTIGIVYTLAEFGGEIYGGGSFSTISGRTISRFARWNGTAWRTVGGGLDNTNFTPMAVNDFAEYDGKLVLCGGFNRAGGMITAGVATWDGVDWGTLSSGSISPGIGAVAVHNGELIAASTLATWRWNGTVWSNMSLAGTRDLLSAGGELLAATSFGVYRWNGLGWDVIGPCTQPVTSLTVHNGRVIASGMFTTIGNVAANRIAAWDGSGWEALGAGLDGIAFAACSHGGDLYVGGVFANAGGAPAARIARWDGDAWHPLGSGTSQSVNAMASYGGVLVVGGDFTTAGGIQVERMAVWDGSQWLPAGQMGGVNSSIHRIMERRGELLVGGQFLLTGGRISYFWGRWTSGAPFVNSHPGDVVVESGGEAVLSVEVGATGSLTPVYRWRRGGVELEDGPTAHGSVIAGAATAALMISGARIEDAGVYDVVVSTPCGGATGGPATVTVVAGTCPADWDGDGDVNSADISAFLGAWIASLTDGELVADFDGDGAVNSGDISAFLTAWIADLQGGC